RPTRRPSRVAHHGAGTYGRTLTVQKRSESLSVVARNWPLDVDGARAPERDQHRERDESHAFRTVGREQRPLWFTAARERNRPRRGDPRPSEALAAGDRCASSRDLNRAGLEVEQEDADRAPPPR